MNKIVKNLTLALGMLAIAIGFTTQTQSLAQKNSQNNSGATIRIDGSSTVYPITQAVAKRFQSNPDNQVQVDIKISGTTSGFEKFCTGKTDINNASRPILQAEMETCKKNNIRYMEFPIAFDALTVAVNPQNNWAQDITIAELKKMWEPAAQGKILRWNQIRSSWPNTPLKLYGAGDKSGTFDYFTEATVGKARASRKDYIASEDDDVLVDGVAKNANALGYFGYAYYQANRDKLKLVAIDNGNGPILPSLKTVEKNQYQPLSRPLFIYVNIRSSSDRQSLTKFVTSYINTAATVASSVGYIPLPEKVRDINYIHLYRGKTGTVFGGKARLNTKISDLLPKKAEY
jgi:phosphate transport system substrate-binding protein